MITALFGPSTGTTIDTTPPVVKITAPTSGAPVAPGFTVTAKLTDTGGVASADLKLDGQSLQILTASPFSWTTPQNLGEGSHHLEVIGTDTSGNTASRAIDVSYSTTMCTHDSDCNDASLVCDSGHCVAGPTTPGGLGTPCSGNADCASSECADDGQGHKYCVENCDPMASTCPTGFGCVTTSGTGGVCWPGAGTNNNNGGSGGCSATGGTGVLAVGLCLGVLALARRRRRH